MAYEAPTVDDVFARFPALDTGTADDQIEALIADALTQVDDSWLEKDYKMAIIYLVAHWATSESGDVVDRAGAISSESFGPMSRSYAMSSVESGGKDQLGSTEYGRRFLELRRKNFPGIAVV